MLGATLVGAAVALGVSIRLVRRLVPFRMRFELPLLAAIPDRGLPLAGSQMLGWQCSRRFAAAVALSAGGRGGPLWRAGEAFRDRRLPFPTSSPA